MLALNPSVSEALHVKGTADITAKNCAIWDNSSSNSGLYQNGNATITAASIYVVGNYYGSNFSPKPSTSVAVFADPLATQFATDYAATYASAFERKSAQATTQLSRTTAIPCCRANIPRESRFRTTQS